LDSFFLLSGVSSGWTELSILYIGFAVEVEHQVPIFDPAPSILYIGFGVSPSGKPGPKPQKRLSILYIGFTGKPQ
jgi:hypothetical protein